MSQESLQQYRNKRSPSETPEPMGDERPFDTEDSIFVIQQHDASNMHWDLRLEIDGVLASWAVPKGPSTDPSEKRLAIRTEDHPLGYAAFEGTIPEDQYGGGSVLVWDRGTFENIKTDDDGRTVPLKQCLEDGEILFRLSGEKLNGGWSLILFREDDDQWLLIKKDDDGADARRNPVSTQQKSVLSGVTIEEMQKEMADS